MNVGPAESQMIQNGLRSLRRLRVASHLPWLIFPFIAVIYFLLPTSAKSIAKPIFNAFFAWVFVGFMLSFLLGAIQCPRCSKTYHRKATGKGLFAGESFNYFTKECMHCRLKLDGSNASVPFEEKA